MSYRLRIDMVYSSTGNANAAVTAINNSLSSAGRAETSSRTGSTVTLDITGLTEAEADSLRVSLTGAWSSVARTGGLVAVARVDDL